MIDTPLPTKRLELESMSPEFMKALLSGQRAEAEAIAGLVLPADWPGDDERFLHHRLSQIQADPSIQPWLMRAMVLRGPNRTFVGHIGFHGRPNDNGAVELGYTVYPKFRRRGYATEATRGLMGWALRQHRVGRFLVSVSPDNDPSLAMAVKLGFRRIGEQMDEEDGLELVHVLVLD